MCTFHTYTNGGSDGHVYKEHTVERCSKARHGRVCENMPRFRHDNEYPMYAEPSSPSRHLELPPTPPRSSHSGSGSDGEHLPSPRRRSVHYAARPHVIDIESRRSHGNSRDTFYIDSPSGSTSPLRQYSHSRGSSSGSAATDLYETYEPRYRERVPRDQERPTTTQPTITLQVINQEAPHKRHHRHGSSKTSSQESKEEEHDRKLRERIARENMIIHNRPPLAPIPPMTTRQRANSHYRRGSISIEANPVPSMMEKLRIDEDVKHAKEMRRMARRAERDAEREDEEQKNRLKERMTIPKRRASVSMGSARYP
ncbi:hypothetical protein F4780DRAFT_632982 [Xylariomycetidae sp. FL0641]|nr:hypothetical protein F4780DRAFT_632982 [Xylariomycetidae sp. FL0641]